MDRFQGSNLRVVEQSPPGIRQAVAEVREGKLAFLNARCSTGKRAADGVPVLVGIRQSRQSAPQGDGEAGPIIPKRIRAR